MKKRVPPLEIWWSVLAVSRRAKWSNILPRSTGCSYMLTFVIHGLHTVQLNTAVAYC